MKGQKTITRRQFVRGAAGGAAAAAGAAAFAIPAAAGSEAQQCPPCTCGDVVEKWDEEADVVVLGLGAAGSAAAITAHDAGANVLVLEKMETGGGSAALSGGIVYAARTSVQKTAKVEDTPDGMYKYWMAINQDLLDPDWMKTLAEESAGVVEWLLSEGAEYQSELLFFSGVEKEYEDVTPAIMRGHATKGQGKGLMEVLIKAVTARKIRVMYETPAEKLIVGPAGEVIGVVAKANGKALNIKATRGVVLATGGMARNRHLLGNYYPLLLRAAPYCAPGVSADGMLMAAKVGAPILGTGMLTISVAPPGLEIKAGEETATFSSSRFLYQYPAIFVNETGKRFTDETAFYETLTFEVMDQEAAYCIFDDVVKQELGENIGYGFSVGLETEIEKGLIKTGDTVGEVAEALGLDPQTVEETVTQFNENMAKGSDPDFDRDKALEPVDKPPFYGFKITGAFNETLGGTGTNASAQVLDAFGQPIPRLYAGGSTTASIRNYPGSGAFLINALVFGRIGGKNAAAEKPWE